ncbi:hypothetical protein FHT86_003931 [Rhizobium sp. BK313]|nr:hypothetical protein [Rhizobium sp. BK313]
MEVQFLSFDSGNIRHIHKNMSIFNNKTKIKG